MEILVGTDRQVPGREELLSFIGFEVLAGLGPCASRVSNVHVHLSAETGGRIGPVSMRCRLEVRPEGHEPLAVMHRALSKDDAVRGAVGDMRGVLERMFRRIDAHGATETTRRSA
ncbi:hypothetical protein [Nocardioides pocheonensis]|uniref:hypothetical protein n=1 Tax=Nocardioides pocheonensis TaxID=661485 RepID=UPI00160B7E65|nr:hypothetical protein [Nocardioides pocheonensis]